MKSNESKTVKEIMAEWLVERGFTALYKLNDYSCRCFLTEEDWGECMQSDCMPGHAVKIRDLPPEEKVKIEKEHKDFDLNDIVVRPHFYLNGKREG